LRPCEACGRDFPEVFGEAEQKCPYCGRLQAASPASQPQPQPQPFAHERVDPVAALRHAFQLLSRKYGVLLLVMLPAALVDLAVGVAVVAFVRAQGIPTDVFAMGVTDRLRYLGVALPLSLLSSVVGLASWSLVAAVALQEDGVRPKGALRAMAGRLHLALAVGLLLTLAWTAGLLLLIVPGLVFLHWFLYAPAALVETGSVPRAFERSRAFARERRTYGFTAVVLLVYFGLFVLDTLLASPESSLLQLVGVPSDYADAAATALGAWPLAMLVPLLPAAYYSLAQRAPDVPPPTTPLPTAPAERFRTTKCPQCGTLVPYTATGGAVDVKCPVCGREGRVLG
jgi:phage FluMu protein Com